MIDRTAERFGLKPKHLAADSAYGSAANLAWLVKQRGIAPHIPVFDKSGRTDGTFSRSDFVFDAEQDRYTCPEGKHLVQFRRTYATLRSGITKEGTRLDRARKRDCDACALKPRCCPNTPARKIPRDVNEDARDMARALADTPAFERSRHRRKKVEMLFAHPKRILRLNRLRLRGPNGAREEFLEAGACWGPRAVMHWVLERGRNRTAFSPRPACRASPKEKTVLGGASTVREVHCHLCERLRGRNAVVGTAALSVLSVGFLERFQSQDVRLRQRGPRIATLCRPGQRLMRRSRSLSARSHRRGHRAVQPS